jgi:hypothetical protein
MIPRRRGAAGLTAFAALCISLAAGCASFKPVPLEQIPFRDRVETESHNGFRVSVSALSRDEAKKAFGIDLYENQIQPVWIRIENETDEPCWLMLHGLDPNYFSAREAAYMSHYRFRGVTNRRMDEHFAKLGILPPVPPQGETSGFAFTNVKLGTKEVRIRLLGNRRVEDFQFYLTVPGFRADYHELDWDAFKKETDFIDLETEKELLEVFEALPCCTTRKNGTGKGDPLNLIVIAPERGLLAFIRAGWDETELLTRGSGWRTFKAFFGGTYKYSPMSALYYDDRAQDLGLQKARDTIHERNHLRLWVTPYRYRGDYIYVGTITRDIGVYFTTRAWNLTTHAIDPEVDEARNYLVEDLLTTEAIHTFGAVPGVGAANKDEPHRNLMFAPWWTDGRRAVLLLGAAEDRIPIADVDYFRGYQPGRLTREMTGRKLEGGSLADLKPLVEEEGREAERTDSSSGKSPLPDNPLAETRWTLTTLEEKAPLPDTTVTIGFTADGTVNGSDGCGNYRGSYSIEGTTLRFPDEFAATMIACPEPIMNQAQVWPWRRSRHVCGARQPFGRNFVESDGVQQRSAGGRQRHHRLGNHSHFRRRWPGYRKGRLQQLFRGIRAGR